MISIHFLQTQAQNESSKYLSRALCIRDPASDPSMRLCSAHSPSLRPYTRREADVQDAFRSLLSTPRPAGASRSGEASGSRSGTILGKAAPKRGWGLKPKDTYVHVVLP